jgi:hypothetical protein
MEETTEENYLNSLRKVTKVFYERHRKLLGICWETFLPLIKNKKGNMVLWQECNGVKLCPGNKGGIKYSSKLEVANDNKTGKVGAQVLPCSPRHCGSWKRGKRLPAASSEHTSHIQHLQRTHKYLPLSEIKGKKTSVLRSSERCHHLLED